MSTYNGERFLNEQLASISSQDYKDFFLFVRDDGSIDQTTKILNDWQKRIKLQWYQGENLGPSQSFFDLLVNSPEADFYAFCDQDDVWSKDKIGIAVKSLEKCRGFAMYFSRPQLADSYLNPIESPDFNVIPSIEESIVKSVVTGCTLVINKKLRDEIVKYIPTQVLMHDSWIYKVCMCLGGTAIYDSNYHILYRQHDNNVMGLKNNYKNIIFRRIRNSVLHSKCIRSGEVTQILNNYTEVIPSKYYKLIKDIVFYRQSFISKYRLLTSFSVPGATVNETILLKSLILFNKF